MGPIRLPNPILWLAIPLALVLIAAIACGGEDPTAVPTNTPVSAAPTDTPVPAPPADTPVPPPPTATLAPGETPRPTATPTPPPPQPTFTPTPTAVPTPTLEPGIEPKYGGQVPMHAYSAPLLYHAPGSSYQSVVSASPMWSALLQFNPETPALDDISGDLAETWEVSEDGRTYTFRLHDNIVWHDGTPFTSDDMVYNWDYYLCPTCLPAFFADETLQPSDLGEHNRTIGQFRGLHESHDAPDRNTFRVTSQFASPGMLPLFALDDTPIFPKHLASQGKFQNFRTPDYLIGTGPFKLVEYVEDIKIEQEKNEDYYVEGRPYFDGITHFILTDKNAIIAAYKTGQVLMGNAAVNNLSIAESQQIIEELGDQITAVWIGPSFNITTMMNTRVEPASDPNVRKAINLVMHRQEAINLLTGGRGVIGTPVPPGFAFSFPYETAVSFPGFREDSPGVKSAEDIAMAQSLVQDAGFGPGYDLTITCRKVIEYCDVALILKDQLEKWLEWDVTVRQMESAAGSQAYNDADFQIAIQANSFTLPNPDNAVVAYVRGQMPLRTGWEVPDRVKTLVEEISRELDPEEAANKVREANSLLLDSPLAWPVWYYTVRAQLIDKRIRNFHPYTVQASSKRHSHIWCDPAC